ncbi:hypothetical protein IWQ61_005616 [Dispira simplex]|nr:hypothetical protein IWQ61_005616 [Dispira simplex]
MLKSMQADKIRKRLEKGNISWDSVITKLEELQTDAKFLVEVVDQIVKLSQKPDENQATLAEKQGKRVELWDNYCKNRVKVLSMLPDEFEKDAFQIDSIGAAITLEDNIRLLRALQRGVESLQLVRADLKDVETNFKAGQPYCEA